MEKVKEQTDLLFFRQRSDLPRSLRGSADFAYNSEKESFAVSFNNVSGRSWKGTMNIPIARAEAFKMNVGNFRKEVEDNNWCFVENFLFPTIVTVYEVYEERIGATRTLRSVETFSGGGRREESRSVPKHKIHSLPVINQSDIIFSFDDFGINNPYLKGFVFNYNKALVEARAEAERKRIEGEIQRREEAERRQRESEQLQALQRQEELHRQQQAKRRASWFEVVTSNMEVGNVELVDVGRKVCLIVGVTAFRYHNRFFNVGLLEGGFREIVNAEGFNSADNTVPIFMNWIDVGVGFPIKTIVGHSSNGSYRKRALKASVNAVYNTNFSYTYNPTNTQFDVRTIPSVHKFKYELRVDWIGRAWKIYARCDHEGFFTFGVNINPWVGLWSVVKDF
jgi:hypothetical protein